MKRIDFFKNTLIYCEDTKEQCQGYTEYAKSKHWKKVRTQKLREQPYCYICNKKKTSKCKTKFNVHHKNYRILGHESIIEDLVTLCEPCHKFIHKYKVECPNLIELPPEQIKQFKKMNRQQNIRRKTV